MFNRINTTHIAAIVMMAAACVLTGCEQSNKKSADSLTNKNVLTVKCVASYLQPDGSRYYTEQEHKVFYPQLKTILFTATEPQGKYEWSILNGAYAAPKIGKTKPFSPELMFSKDISTALLKLYTANPIDGTAVSESGEKLDIDGQIFNKIDSNIENVQLFSDHLTGRINTAKTVGKKTYILRAYNYQPVKRLGLLVPTKIDVYAEKTPKSRDLVAQFNCNITKN